MNTRCLLAGLAAGVVFFFWGSFTHIVLGTEERILRTFPNDAAVTAYLKENLKEPGLYFFPNEMDPQKMAQRVATTPRGILAYTPAGVPFSMGASLGMQLLNCVVCGLIAAWLFSMAAPALTGLGRRVLFTILLGVFATLLVVAPFCNWYGFPVALIATGLLDAVVGWGLAGLVLAKMIR